MLSRSAAAVHTGPAEATSTIPPLSVWPRVTMYGACRLGDRVREQQRLELHARLLDLRRSFASQVLNVIH